MVLLHIGSFHLAVDQQRQSLWHRLSPRTRVLCTLLFIFATALTPNGRWLTWLIYAAGLASVIMLSRVSLGLLLKRVAVEFIFIGTVLLGTLFQQGGTVLWQWGWLQITSEGVTVLGSVTLKALLSLLMINLLVLTTAIPALLHALSELKLPPLLVAILASMYRYIAVLVNEFTSMRRAAAARNLSGSNRWQRQVIGNMMGALFVRTFERGDRVHQAMLSRGYTGLPPVEHSVKPASLDYAILTFVTALLVLGQAPYL